MAFVALAALFAVVIDTVDRASDDAAGPADAAVVLGAAVWGDTPSPVFEARIEHAVDLYRTGRVPLLVFTGGQSPEDSLSEAVAAAWWAQARGVPAGAMACETTSRITEQNLSGTAQLARTRGLGRVLVVSDPLHLPRAVRMARDLGLDAAPSPTPTTRYRGVRSRAVFLAREVYFTAGYLARRPFARSDGAAMEVGPCPALR